MKRIGLIHLVAVGWLPFVGLVAEGQSVNVAEFAELLLVHRGTNTLTGLEFLCKMGNTKPVVLDGDNALEVRWDQPRAVRCVELGVEGDLPDG
ncbi:MAG: hypothetical protein N3G20_00305, partial [Verrucomicrobiae bacterium]|nr:hypothetical protein [Verrucomicrobiae bacterium]